MMVVTLTQSTQFTKSEQSAFDILERMSSKEKTKIIAARCVRMAIRLN